MWVAKTKSDLSGDITFRIHKYATHRSQKLLSALNYTFHLRIHLFKAFELSLFYSFLKMHVITGELTYMDETYRD